MENSERASGRRFDRDHGVTTHAVLFLTDLDPETTGDACAHATHYEAVPVAAFRELLARVPHEVVRRSIFVDLGAGMGRAVMLAMEYPFKQIVGIEISPALFEVARENLAHVRELATQCKDVRLHRADARHRRFPRGELLVFLYNPFDGEALDDVLDHLAERPDNRAETILYHVPEHGERIRARGYELVAETAHGNVYRIERKIPSQALPRTSRSFCE